MILRRLGDAFRRHDWFTVAVETLIVVLGVFLGIQLGNLNEARLASAQEARLLARLAVDMRVVETELASDLESFERTRSGTARLLDIIRSGESPDDEAALRSALWAANFYYELPSVSPVFQEIVTGSGLSSLSNPDLRSALSRYGDFHERLLRDSMLAKSVILDPHSQYLRAVSWSSNPAEWETSDRAIVGYRWRALTEAEPELQAWLAYQNDSVRGADQTLSEVRHILALLGEQPRSPAPS